MGLKRFSPGERITSFPAQSWNTIVEEVEQLQSQLSTIEETRSPRDKSPVFVQLIWADATAIEPGHTVRLVGSAAHPSIDDSAQFSGLTFFCLPFSEEEPDAPYAITMGEIDGSTIAAGDLTTRSSASAGTLTMGDDEHGVEEDDIIAIVWKYGNRAGVVAGAVSGTSIPISGGGGDDLPDITEGDVAATVVVEGSTGMGVLPESYWAKVYIVDETHEFAVLPSSGTMLTSDSSGRIPIFWKEAGTGGKWAVVNIAGGGGGGGGTSEFVAILSSAIPAGSASAAGSGAAVIKYYGPDGALTAFTFDGVEVYNPFPYDANPGIYPVEGQGFALLGEVNTALFSLTGFDLRGHDSWVAGDDQVLVHAAGDTPAWVNSGTFVGGGGDPFDPSDLQDAITNLTNSVAADKIEEGYCVTILDTNPRHLHLDQITTDAGTTATDRNLAEFQFWIHNPGATARTDAKWITCDDYDTTDSIQLPGHDDGVWNFRTQSDWLKTADDYAAGASASDMQFVVHFQPGGAPPIWKAATDYSVVEGKQLLLNDAGAWEWASRAEALTPDGAESGTVAIKSVDSVELNLVGSTLEVKINYTIYNVFGTAGSSGNVSDTVATTVCP